MLPHHMALPRSNTVVNANMVDQQQSQQSCPMCASHVIDIIFQKEWRGHEWLLRRCAICGLHFTDPLPTQPFLDQCYSGEYHSGLKDAGVAEETFGPKY